ncbi:MAG: hypothetical protein ACFFC3_10215 [Candidatus Odinarchaeota archaeon]
MKSVYKKFCCPECGEVRYININGICFDCKNKKNLITLAKERKLKQNLKTINHFISIENYN